MTIHRIEGAKLTDDIFEITLESGEYVVWNVTKLQRAAEAGAFGTPRYAPTADLPPTRWENWDATDRAKVDAIKKLQWVLDEPAIAIETDHPGHLICCFADGQHRITARQELGLKEIIFYIVPVSMERQFRVTGFEVLTQGGKP